MFVYSSTYADKRQRPQERAAGLFPAAGNLMRRFRLRGMRLAVVLCSMQLILGLVLAVLFGWIYDFRTAVAAMFGAITAAVPGLYMALLVLPNRPSSGMRQQARRLVLGQVGKVILTGGLFVAAILVFKRDLGPLLVTYAVCLLCYWPALTVTR